MSGHNKWSTIKRKKGALDSKRSKLFSRISKEISIAVKEGGSDPESNSRLRLAIQNAKGANMPKDNIHRAISKADSDESSFHELTFEGYAPGGVALFIECLTDNNNRTISAVRSIFTKRGGSLGTNGSLSFIFSRKGIFTISAKGIDQDEFELTMIDAGAEDLEFHDEVIVITTPLEEFGNMQKTLEELSIPVENAELQRIANTTTRLDIEAARRVLRFVEDIEENDDVASVFHNLEMTDDLARSMDSDD
jgi:YebC/PmpR family DNA-binding regulatory protein